MDMVLFYHPCDVRETLPEKSDLEPTLNTTDVLLSRHAAPKSLYAPPPAGFLLTIQRGRSVRSPGLLVMYPTLGRRLPKGRLPPWPCVGRKAPLQTRLPFMEQWGLCEIESGKNANEVKELGFKPFNRVKGEQVCRVHRDQCKAHCLLASLPLEQALST